MLYARDIFTPEEMKMIKEDMVFFKGTVTKIEDGDRVIFEAKNSFKNRLTSKRIRYTLRENRVSGISLKSAK